MIDPQQALATACAIVAMQEPSGAIPWEPGRHCDPWDHVEAVIGLDAAGFHREAKAGLEWMRSMQAPDGSWSSSYIEGQAHDRTLDSNFIAYFAVGAWHHFLVTEDPQVPRRYWPVVEKAIDFVLAMQMQSGAIMWARDAEYKPWPGALLTASSCIYLSLNCAITMAEHLGFEMPEWELALARLGRAIREDPSAFEPRDRYSMDWYYPVLSGALSQEAAHERIEARWDEFVVPGKGALCVLDRPWVTTGETCELALACARIDRMDLATSLLDWVQHLRTEKGFYWTGANHPRGDIYPLERTSWNAGAVLIARELDVLESPTRALFTGSGLVHDDLYAENAALPDA